MTVCNKVENKSDLKYVKRNVILSVSVQIVSFTVSFILNLILPKFISEIEYSYWQTFLLYVSYVPLLHFGFLDGLILRYSKFDFDALDKPLIRAQFKIFFPLEILFALLLVGISLCMTESVNRLILTFIGFSIITTNVFTYTSYFFQITNRIENYAILVLLQRGLIGVGTIFILFMGGKHFYEICAVYILADAIAVIWGASKNKGLYYGKSTSLSKGFVEFKENVLSGGMLLVANISSMLLVGSAKMFVQWNYDALTFGKVAFAFNASNLFLTFVAAASVALFPSLKRVEQDRLPDYYVKIRKTITPWLFIALFTYFPGYYLIKFWLPNYSTSLLYLGLLLPIIVYSSRVSLLTNNYLKALRKEKEMLLVNIISLVLALILFAISSFVVDSLIALLLSLVFVIMLRSIISEIIVMRLINRMKKSVFLLEILSTIFFSLLIFKFNGLF